MQLAAIEFAASRVAASATSALQKFKRKGGSAEYGYLNGDGNTVHFEFVGVMELLELGAECGPDKVWYNVRERLLPMERRDAFIPAEADLNAIRNEA